MLGFGKARTAVDEVIGPPLTFWPAFAVIALGVIALNIIGVVPVLLGALQDEHRLSAAGIGETAMLELVAMGVSTGLCGAFLKAARMKTIGVLGCIALAAADLATVFASGSGVLLVRTAAGVPEGVLIWITVGMIVRSRTPERWSGVFFTGQTVAQLLLAGAFWLWVLPKFGANGGFLTLGLTTLVGAPIALMAPSKYKALTQSDGLHGAPPPLGWLALLASVVFVSANGAISVYIEPLAHQAGLSADVARLAVFAGLVAQVCGGTLATLIAGKVRYISVFAVCVVVYLTAWSIYGFTNKAWLFVAVTALAGVTTLLISPFLTPMIIEADPTRRAAMQGAGAQILGGAAGPLLASFLVSDADVRGVLVMGAVALLIGFAMIFAIHFSAKRT
jgi:predicted MFS family arabinose efflux permease